MAEAAPPCTPAAGVAGCASAPVASRRAPGRARPAPPLLLGGLLLAAALFGPRALAQAPAEGGAPRLDHAALDATLAGQPIRRLDVVDETGAQVTTPAPRTVSLGDPLTPALAERLLSELAEGGAYASLRVEAEPTAGGVAVRVVVLRRRVVRKVRVLGTRLDAEQTLRAASLREGGEITAPELPALAARIQAHYRDHGFPTATVRVEALDTDDPLETVLVVHVTAGEPERVVARRFDLMPRSRAGELEQVARSYAVALGDRVDGDALLEADRALETALQARGWHEASVKHAIRPGATPAEAVLEVTVAAGPHFVLTFEGNQAFDAAQLERALALDEAKDRSPATLVALLRAHYLRHGFFDVEVTVAERQDPGATTRELAFTLREGLPVSVAAREYPCLTGERDARAVGREIDSFLSEALPETGVLSSVDPAAIDAVYGPKQQTGARVAPRVYNPWVTYVPEIYDRALKHLRDLYRAEGYLSAKVGPVTLVRRACAPESPPDTCVPLGPPPSPAPVCQRDAEGLPLDPPALPPSITCTPDPARGLRCEPEAVLVIPIQLGPRTELYDLAFVGHDALVERDLARIADLDLGRPLSLPDLDAARRRLLDAYAEEGFAFAQVDVETELSPDHTRGRVTFTIHEGERVIVSSVVIRGARRTREAVIRRRIALEVDQPYRRSLVRKTEERLALLGVFSGIVIELEGPTVPERRKTVVITLQEKAPQYVEPRLGFSTGEGPRVAFEYGHLDLGGLAMQLRTRVELNYLFDFLIAEDDVRAKFVELREREGIAARLERQLSVAVEFPDVGLSPLFRLGVEGLSLRDNSRDYGISKSAALVTLMYRPSRRVSAQLGPSLELNDAGIFGVEEKGSLAAYVREHPGRARLFRVPEGRSVAFAQQVSAAWDRRDDPLAATRGTFLGTRVEHVRAVPDDELDELFRLDRPPTTVADAGVFDAVVSDFFRITSRAAGYVPFGGEGTSLALSLGWGVNVQRFPGSQTYPDRLFTLGGVDSLRGFLQDSLVPEDIAQQLLDPSAELTIDQVVVRGGDFFVNPRTELRVPLLPGTIETALFVDAGNLWTDAARVDLASALDPTGLRYTAGTGLRVSTPIGPLVFDYGLNLQRVIDTARRDSTGTRSWESLGAFHFSIGLF